MSAVSVMPTLQEELDRKTHETLEWLILGRDQCRLSDIQFEAGTDALFMAVSGLVDKDFIEIITEARREPVLDKATYKRLLVKQDEWGEDHRVVKWTAGDDFFSVVRLAGGKVVENMAVFDDPGEAKLGMINYAENLKKDDWVEL